MTDLRTLLVGPRTALWGTLALAGLSAACEGSNAWTNLPTAGGGDRAPEVEIVAPDSGGTVAVQDSVRIAVRIRDNAGIDSVTLSGFALRGVADLGTQQRVERFAPKVVALGDARSPVRDTTLVRYLLPTADSLAESPVLLVARVRDLSGNVRADTLRIALGGPRVQVVAPLAGAEIRAGSELRVRVLATDTVRRLQSLTVRLRGAAPMDSSLTLDASPARVDTTIVLRLPAERAGTDTLRVVVRNLANDTARSSPVVLNILPGSADQTPPTVRFSVEADSRAEFDDSVTVSVSAADGAGLRRLGVSVRPIRRLATRTDTLPVLVRDDTTGALERRFRFPLDALGVTPPEDTTYVLRLEVTAFAVDRNGNCAASTVPGTPLSQPCRRLGTAPGDTVLANGAGARTDIVLVRGTTVRPAGASDRLVDLVADRRNGRVLVSNFTRSRIEVLPVGAGSFSASPLDSVGSRPWGLAISRSQDTLFVANSGGTNISVVPLTGGPLREAGRITTPDIRLYSFEYVVDKDSASTVRDEDFSDRPQFLGQTATGRLIYSTVPTSTRERGTIRIYDPARDSGTRERNRATEIFVNYAGRALGKGIVVNALDAGLTTAGEITVCPRPARIGGAELSCLTRRPLALAVAVDSLRSAGLTDTRVEINLDIATVGLTDTTFVAVSGDHSTIAFGEGGVEPGRVLLFKETDGRLNGLSTETRDLVGNAAERVVGLGLNADGSLGVARGRQTTYFFEDDLRLQGVVESGPASGGSALHPENAGYPSGAHRRGFVSGVDASGTPFVDVIDSYYFRRIRRITIRDRVIGALIAVPVASTDPEASRLALRLYGITASGVVQIGLTPADLR